MATPSLTVQIACDEDLPALATVAIDAYITNPQTLTYWMAKEASREDLLAWRLQSLRNDLHNDTSLSYLVLLDNDVNEIVSFAIWQIPKEGLRNSPENASREKVKEDESRTPLPPGMKVELYKQSVGQTERIKANFVNREKDFVLKSTATLPKHQGRGCCSLLLSHALKEVDAAGAKAFLKATPQGRPIYKRHGWQEVDSLVYNLEEHGGPSALTLYAMERPSFTDVTSPEAVLTQT